MKQSVEQQSDNRDPVCSNSVIFIRGIMPRSGTNYVADILGKHSHACVNPRNFWECSPFRFHSDLKLYLGNIAATKHAYEFNPDDMLPFIGKAWLDFFSEGLPEFSCMVLKEPSVNDLDIARAMFPQARTIIVVRDGRDIVASSLKAGFVLPKPNILNRRHWRLFLPDGKFRALCKMYAQAAEITGQEYRSREGVLFPSYIVRYEDLFKNPDASVRTLLDYAGLSEQGYDWDGLHSMPIRGSSFLRDTENRINFSQGVVSDARFLPIGRWHDWTSSQRRIFDQVCGSSMRELGYDYTWNQPIV